MHVPNGGVCELAVWYELRRMSFRIVEWPIFFLIGLGLGSASFQSTPYYLLQLWSVYTVFLIY